MDYSLCPGGRDQIGATVAKGSGSPVEQRIASLTDGATFSGHFQVIQDGGPTPSATPGVQFLDLRAPLNLESNSSVSQ